MSYYRNSVKPTIQKPAVVDNSETEVETNLNIPVEIQAKAKVLSHFQKYKCAFKEAQKLATLASEVSMVKYRQRIEVLRSLVLHWEHDEDIKISSVSVKVFKILFDVQLYLHILNI